MTIKAMERAKMPAGTSVVLDSRTLQKDYATLLPVLKKGLRVLDVGCGTGAISKGIAKMVGQGGYVVGIDNSAHLIAKGKEEVRNVHNIELVQADLFDFVPEENFDLLVSARVLQWLNNPKEALIKFKDFLKPEGQISVLDYDHTKLEWKPEPPASMKKFYNAFLDWRSEAGMDNEIAEHLQAYFTEIGFHSIEILNADETYQKGDEDFTDKVRIWSHVAALRGGQMVASGFISEAERLLAIKEYDAWTKNEAVFMKMKLKDIRAKI